MPVKKKKTAKKLKKTKKKADRPIKDLREYPPHRINLLDEKKMAEIDFWFDDVILGMSESFNQKILDEGEIHIDLQDLIAHLPDWANFLVFRDTEFYAVSCLPALRSFHEMVEYYGSGDFIDLPDSPSSWRHTSRARHRIYFGSDSSFGDFEMLGECCGFKHDGFQVLWARNRSVDRKWWIGKTLKELTCAT